MAELLIIINPNASNREAGDVCVVKEDGWPWSELERKLFVVVRVPMTVEEAEEKYLKTGISDNVLSAHEQACQNFLNAKENREALYRIVEQTRPNYESYHHRKFNLDTTKLPVELVKTAVNTKQALLDAYTEAKASARAEMESELTKINSKVGNLEKQMRTAEILEMMEASHRFKDKNDLIEASRRGRMKVIKPILDAIPTPPIKVLTKVELDDMTIEKI